MERQVDGLILLNGIVSNEILIDIAERVPTIIVGRTIAELKGQCLAFDDFEAARKATQYLIDSGHRRIAHISGLPNHEDSIDRRNGYLFALDKAGIAPDSNLIIDGDFTEPSGMMAVEMLMMRGNNFSAIFAANDQMAFGARLALSRRGMRVPEDVSIVGFDDQAPAAYMIPPLTTIRRMPLEVGEAAGRALVDLVRGKNILLPEFHSTLMIRESVIRRL
jgi:LacI family transcriptional regulator